MTIDEFISLMEDKFSGVPAVVSRSITAKGRFRRRCVSMSASAMASAADW